MSTTLFRSKEREEQGFSVRDVRLKLHENGYEPIATRGKKPVADGWQNGEITRDRIIKEILSHPGATNTGLRTDHFPVVDIDLWNDDHVVVIAQLVTERLGLTPLFRRGRKGLAMCYRLSGTPIGKLIIKGDTDERTALSRPVYKTLVEILGRSNQVVAYGVHPETGRVYEWLEPGGEPLKVGFDDLPAVTPDQLRGLADAVRLECAGLGYNVKGLGVQGGEDTISAPIAYGRLDDARDVTTKFLDLIPSAKRSRSGWYNFGCPACGHRDHKSGIQVLANGGFVYHCFHASCDFNKSTGWQPPNRIVGDRVKHLYELLGGDAADLKIENRRCGYESVAEMLADFARMGVVR